MMDRQASEHLKHFELFNDLKRMKTFAPSTFSIFRKTSSAFYQTFRTFYIFGQLYFPTFGNFVAYFKL